MQWTTIGDCMQIHTDCSDDFVRDITTEWSQEIGTADRLAHIFVGKDLMLSILRISMHEEKAFCFFHNLSIKETKQNDQWD